MSAARWGIVIRVVDGDEAEISERCDSLVSRLATLADESLSYPVGKLGRRRSSEEPGRCGGGRARFCFALLGVLSWELLANGQRESAVEGGRG